MEIQERLKLAKLEMANLIQEGKRLRLANEQLQKDIDLRSRYIVNFKQIKTWQIYVLLKIDEPFCLLHKRFFFIITEVTIVP